MIKLILGIATLFAWNLHSQVINKGALNITTNLELQGGSVGFFDTNRTRLMEAINFQLYTNSVQSALDLRLLSSDFDTFSASLPATYQPLSANLTLWSGYAPSVFASQANLTTVSNRVVDLETSTNAIRVDLDAHTGNIANPHSVTAAQVGLGNVPNYGVASQAEAEAGTSSTKLMTPERVAQAITALGGGGGGGGTSWPPTNSGTLLRQVHFLYTNKTSTVTTIPTDGTKPQSNEGGTTFTNSYTPISASSNSVIKVEMLAYITTSIARTVSGALFKDGDPDAIAAAPIYVANADAMVALPVVGYYTNSDNAAVSFSFNYAANAAATTYINRGNNVTLTNWFDAALFSIMTITEIQQ